MLAVSTTHLAMPALAADRPALTVTAELRGVEKLLHGREQLLRLLEAQPDVVEQAPVRQDGSEP